MLRDAAGSDVEIWDALEVLGRPLSDDPRPLPHPEPDDLAMLQRTHNGKLQYRQMRARYLASAE